MKSNNYFLVVILTLIGTLSAAFMATGVKHLSNELNTFMICFYRCLIGLIIIFPFVARNKFKAIKSKNIKLQFFRSLINVISMVTWFAAIGMLQLEKATALGFTTPLFTTILAVIILGEIIKIHRITALVLGFFGVLIIVRPGYLPLDSGTLLMLTASLSFSFVLIMVKKLSNVDSSLTIIFYHLLFMTPLTLVMAIFYWEGINFNQFLIFTFMASFGLISHWCLAEAFKMSDTTFIMPLQFTKLIWASIIGYLIFSELPDIWTWFGAIIIFISAIYITYREAYIKQKTPTTKLDQIVF